MRLDVCDVWCEMRVHVCFCLLELQNKWLWIIFQVNNFLVIVCVFICSQVVSTQCECWWLMIPVYITHHTMGLVTLSPRDNCTKIRAHTHTRAPQLCPTHPPTHTHTECLIHTYTDAKVLIHSHLSKVIRRRHTLSLCSRIPQVLDS